jgi:hypothetical protein
MPWFVHKHGMVYAQAYHGLQLMAAEPPQRHESHMQWFAYTHAMAHICVCWFDTQWFAFKHTHSLSGYVYGGSAS